jgi:hypothetical protein
MLKQGTYWDNANVHVGNASRNATVGGAVGSDPQLYGGNLGNNLLYGSTPTFSGSGSATSNIFSRLF